MYYWKARACSLGFSGPLFVWVWPCSGKSYQQVQIWIHSHSVLLSGCQGDPSAHRPICNINTICMSIIHKLTTYPCVQLFLEWWHRPRNGRSITGMYHVYTQSGPGGFHAGFSVGGTGGKEKFTLTGRMCTSFTNEEKGEGHPITYNIIEVTLLPRSLPTPPSTHTIVKKQQQLVWF